MNTDEGALEAGFPLLRWIRGGRGGGGGVSSRPHPLPRFRPPPLPPFTGERWRGGNSIARDQAGSGNPIVISRPVYQPGNAFVHFIRKLRAVMQHVVA